MTIGLIACSARKLQHQARVRELYCSALFRWSLEWAAQRCERVYVLSALHGLVKLDDVLEPYDAKLSSPNSSIAGMWGKRVAGDLTAHEGFAFDIIALAGTGYVRPVRAALDVLGWSGRLDEPLYGMFVGERLGWLRKELGRAA